MKIFDAHLHFWNLNLKKHAWLINQKEKNFLGDYSCICKNYLPKNYLFDISDECVGATHIQAGWDSNNPAEESRWINKISKNLSFPLYIIGYADLTSKELETTLNSHLKTPNFVGIRQILSWHQNPYYSMCSKNFIEDENFKKGFALLRKNKLIFELQAYSHQITKLLPLFQRHEEIPVIIEHCGMPLFFKKTDLINWEKILKKASKLPNLFLKISGLGMFKSNHKNFIGQSAIISKCIESFGVDRCVFGSNFPVDRLFHSFSDLIEKILSCGLEKSELEKIFFKNAIKFYNSK